MTRLTHRLLAVIPASLVVVAVAATPAVADPAWSSATAVPGLSALNVTGTAQVGEVSCSSAGNCGLVGDYSDSLRHIQGFVANEVNFVWGSAESIPGLVDLNTGGAVSDYSFISCTSATACTAGGTYKDSSGNPFSFVVDEASGTWGTAQTLPLSDTLPTGASSQLNDLKCTSPGDCVAVGSYLDVNGVQSYVAAESSGTWSGAVEVPGSGQLNVTDLGGAADLACPAAGECALVGIYSDASKHIQAYADSESSGTWGTAVALPGLATLNVGGLAGPEALSCSSVGSCATGGTYLLSSTAAEPWVASEVSGSWQSAIELPGNDLVNTGNAATVTSVACPADGQCEAVGTYTDNQGGSQDFVVSQSGGSWGSMGELPGTAELNAAGGGQTPFVSCVSSGDCRALGGYGDSTNAIQSFDATEAGGVWQNAEESPGTAALNTEGNSTWEAVSCTTDGGCAAAGVYKDSSGYQQVMVLSSVAPPKPTPPGAPKERVSSRAKGDVTITITPPASDGGASITGYQYSVNGGPWRNAASTTVTVRHLRAKSKVRVRVRAVNSAGDGPPSGTATVKVK
jgi:Fibronectin type III domain